MSAIFEQDVGYRGWTRAEALLLRSRARTQRKRIVIQMCERDYKRLLEGRNALGAALAALVNAPDVATSELAPRSEVLEHARAVLAEYGAHQAFVLEST